MSTEVDKMSFEKELTSLLHKIQQLEENIRLTENQIDKINKQWIIDSDSPLNSVISRDILQEDLEELVVMVFPSAKQVLVRIISKFQKMQQDQDKSEEMEFEEVKVNIESDNEQEDVLDSWYPIEFNERDDETSQESSDPLGMEQSIINDKINSVVKTDKANTKTSKRSILISKKTISKNKDNKSKTSSTGKKSNKTTLKKIMVLELKRLSNDELQKWASGDLKSNNADIIKSHKEGYRCPFCTSCLVVSAPEILVKHIKQKHPEQDLPQDFFKDLKPFKCKFCDVTFTLTSNRLYHERRHTSQEVLHCEFCDRTFNCKRYFNRHKKGRHLIHSKPVRCRMIDCPETFLSANRRNNHIIQCHPEISFQKKTETGKKSNQSVEIVDNKEGYPCPFCLYIVGKPLILMKHIKQQHPKQEISLDFFKDLKPFKCKFCDETFTLRSLRTLHHNMHISQQILHCDLCDWIGNSNKNLQQHKRRHHLSNSESKTATLHRSMKSDLRKFNFIKRQMRTGNESNQSVETIEADGLYRKVMAARNKISTPYVKKSVIQCIYCPRTFPNYPRRSTHVKRMHTNVRKIPDDEEGYRCPFCKNCIVGGPKFLRKHVKKEHPEQEIQPDAFNFLKPYKCKVCDSAFSFKHNRNIHQQRHETDATFTCDQCDKKYKTVRDLQHHKKSLHLHTAFPCKMKNCSERFGSEKARNTHIRECHPEILSSIRYSTKKSKFTLKNCEICDKSLRIYKMSDYPRHVKTHVKNHPEILLSHPEITYLSQRKKKRCEICEKTLCDNRTSTYISHMKTHSNATEITKDRKILCRFCNKVFQNAADLMNHKLRDSECSSSVKVSCSKCPKSYSDRNTLNKHVKVVHSGIEVFKCDLCIGSSHIFVSIQAFKNHKKEKHPDGQVIKYSQKGEGPTENLCPHCGKIFNYVCNLETHIKRIHMTDHVKCPKCVKELPVDKLENHIKTHEKWKSGELKSTKYTAENSNIKCEQCGTYYANKYSLTLHNKRVHLNIRNLVCSLCPRRFYERGSLAFHLKSHENQRKKSVKPKPQEENDDSRRSMVEDDSSNNEIETEIVGEQDLQIHSQEVNVPVVETEVQQLYFQLISS